jgi:pantoate--beta-alanine ligase
MLTVVSRLFDLVRPDLAVFGAKDAQQLFLVIKMVGEQLRSGQRPPLKIIAGPTIRDADGLALSSRNRKLSPQERLVATTINLALTEAAEAAQAGHNATEIRARAIQLLDPEIRLDYLELVDLATFQPVATDFTGPALVIFAGMVGATRLLDNRELRILAPDEHRTEN